MTLDGLAEVLSNVEALQSKMSKSMEEAALAGALVGEKYTKEGAPFKTGNLRGSYATGTESKSDDQVLVRTGTDVEYAPDQEFGTSRMAGTPHLRPGFENHKNEILSAVTGKMKV